MPVIEGLVQNTPEWIIHRQGMVTASNMWRVMAKLKDPKKESAERARYKAELVCEVLTGRATEHYVSPAMETGLEREPLARTAYEVKYDLEAQPGGFWAHDTIPRLGASPDAILGEDGLAEFKCPSLTTHLGYLLSGEIPEEYQLQMQTQMACTGRKWNDFGSYHPDMPERWQLWVKRLERDDKMISAIELETLQFLEEVIAVVKKLEAK